MTEQSAPTVITLDAKNSAEILFTYVEQAQKAGAFLLAESDILKRCKDVLMSGATDPEINASQARQLLIQACQKGQAKGGAFSLDDASIIHKVCQYVGANLEAQTVSPPAPEPVDEDLSALSAAVPLRTPGPKVV
jgi:hypothetical protein